MSRAWEKLRAALRRKQHGLEDARRSCPSVRPPAGTGVTLVFVPQRGKADGRTPQEALDGLADVWDIVHRVSGFWFGCSEESLRKLLPAWMQHCDPEVREQLIAAACDSRDWLLWSCFAGDGRIKVDLLVDCLPIKGSLWPLLGTLAIQGFRLVAELEWRPNEQLDEYLSNALVLPEPAYWYGTDKEGAIAQFYNEWDRVPRSVAASRSDAEAVRQYFWQLPARCSAWARDSILTPYPQTIARRFPGLLTNPQTHSETSGETDWYEWHNDMSERGLYGLEAVTRTKYELLRKPERPLLISEVPEEIQRILLRTRFDDAEFASCRFVESPLMW